MIQLTFLGAAQEVTGSCCLIETGTTRFLIDCGMFQGDSNADEKNRAAITPVLATVDFVLLTHAHIDHSGLLPRLVHLGFKGPIYATSATADLLAVMLADSAHIHEQKSKHDQAEPLYTATQALSSLRQLRRVEYGQQLQPKPGVRCVFHDAGHILGSALIELWASDGKQERKLVSSGDLGQYGNPLLRDPTPVSEADLLVVESTYGNRVHKPIEATLAELSAAVSETIEQRRGNVIVPAFAVGRTQDMLYLLIKLQREGRVPPLSIFVDSPLATEATAVTLKHWRLLDPGAIPLLESAMQEGTGPRIRFVEAPEESATLSRISCGAVIIAASGMCEAGRVQYHLRDNLPRTESSVLIIGFQAAGTLGRRLVDGETNVRIFGDEIPVRARVHTLGGLSAHADQHALLRWLRGFSRPPQRTLVVHGEAQTAKGFAQLIQDRLGWRAAAPAAGETIQL